MAKVTGFWINSRTGEEIEVFEHAATVLQDPARFGLYGDDVKKMVPHALTPERRRELLIDVMKRGWIRVRGYKGNYVFETARVNDDVLYSVLEFAQKHHLWPNERVDIHDITSPAGGGVMSVKQLQTKFQPTESMASVRQDQVAHISFDALHNILFQAVLEAALHEGQELTASHPLLRTRVYEEGDYYLIIEIVNNGDTDGLNPLQESAFRDLVYQVRDTIMEVSSGYPLVTPTVHFL